MDLFCSGSQFWLGGLLPEICTSLGTLGPPSPEHSSLVLLLTVWPRSFKGFARTLAARVPSLDIL